MNKPKFEPKDFEEVNDHEGTFEQAQDFISFKANNILAEWEREGWALVNVKDATEVWAYIGPASRPGGMWIEKGSHDADSTHRALLINIEEIPKACEHEPEFVNKIPGWHHGPLSKAQCRLCGVPLTATWTEAT